MSVHSQRNGETHHGGANIARRTARRHEVARSTMTDMDLAKQYRQFGYVTGVDLLTPDEVRHYRAQWDQLEARIGRDQAQIGVANAQREHPFIWELATHERIVDAVEQVIGPDVVLLGTHFFCKYPSPQEGDQPFVAWHQDVTYWGLTPPRVTTIWLAIDDVDIENGAMQVIPGSHRQGVLDHSTSDRTGNLLSVNQAIDESLFATDAAMDIILRAGQASLHDGMTVHGSLPNRSPHRRCGLTIRYITPDVEIDVEPTGPIRWLPSLLRGKDRHRKNRYFPAPDFTTDTGLG